MAEFSASALSATYCNFSLSWNRWWSITANNGGKLISKPGARIQQGKMSETQATPEVIPRHNISPWEDASTSREETRAFQWNIYNLGQQLVKQQHIRGQMRRRPAAEHYMTEYMFNTSRTKTFPWFFHTFPVVHIEQKGFKYNFTDS